MPKPYTTRQGCLVQTKIVMMPNGQVHEHVTLSGTFPIEKVKRDRRH